MYVLTGYVTNWLKRRIIVKSTNTVAISRKSKFDFDGKSKRITSLISSITMS